MSKINGYGAPLKKNPLYQGKTADQHVIEMIAVLTKHEGLWSTAAKKAEDKQAPALLTMASFAKELIKLLGMCRMEFNAYRSIISEMKRLHENQDSSRRDEILKLTKRVKELESSPQIVHPH